MIFHSINEKIINYYKDNTPVGGGRWPGRVVKDFLGFVIIILKKFKEHSNMVLTLVVA